ncbi:Transcription factor ILR3 [Triticum urartu]|uniref:Transcription factor ILR3 n=1 Tax=Triticum urartu TaxID=4572 RepID=M8AFF1_TRIUA|nr:Transcription factor ILR3 [Triticum urartu]
MAPKRSFLTAAVAVLLYAPIGSALSSLPCRMHAVESSRWSSGPVGSVCKVNITDAAPIPAPMVLYRYKYPVVQKTWNIRRNPKQDYFVCGGQENNLRGATYQNCMKIIDQNLKMIYRLSLSEVLIRIRLGIEDVSGGDSGLGHSNLGKRARDEPSSSGPKSKACREKMRRDKLNDRFLELCSVMNSGKHSGLEECSASNPGKNAKLDKASILSDATRMLTQLRGETEKLKESNSNLRETIKDLKVEKNELRDEKLSLKAEKERLEQQLKAASAAPTGFAPHMPYPAAFHPAVYPPFAPPYQVPANKGAPIPAAFPGMAMWHWLPPTAMDTTQDPKLWPPNA